MDVGYPTLVFQIPLDGFANAGVEGFSRLPAELTFYLIRVNGIAAVMAGAIRNVSNLFAIALAVFSSTEFVEQCANSVDDVDVGFFIPAADVVNLADFTCFQYPANGAAMVFDIKPVTNLLSIAVYRQWLARKRIDDHQRDEFFREVIRPVVIGAVSGKHRQTIGVVVSSHQVVAGGFARRVRTIRLITVGFGKGRLVFSERSVDFIGGNVQEAKVLPGFVLQIAPVGAHRFQQSKGADDVGLNKIFRAVNGAIHVAFGSEIDDGAGLMLSE